MTNWKKRLRWLMLNFFWSFPHHTFWYFLLFGKKNKWNPAAAKVVTFTMHIPRPGPKHNITHRFKITSCNGKTLTLHTVACIWLLYIWFRIENWSFLNLMDDHCRRGLECECVLACNVEIHNRPDFQEDSHRDECLKRPDWPYQWLPEVTLIGMSFVPKFPNLNWQLEGLNRLLSVLVLVLVCLVQIHRFGDHRWKYEIRLLTLSILSVVWWL